ncbi:MAG: DUF5916 domain-containing protein, partial [Candidatus Marinimicrobia bacterium]|nr:DUF5916 domain-containing protein [Candidatus Neomarinimicrobiota bacterium]
PTALYIGIVAQEIHGEVRSTLADRDNLENDDYLILILDTYDDKRSAFAFAVNPLGQQGDGTIMDHTSVGLTFRLDSNPDYIFSSKGVLTEEGFTVEIKIPFKSLRYQRADTQNWGFNVLRHVQHSNYRSTLFNTQLGVASFLAQTGKLVNISGIRRDRVFEINPEIRGSIARPADYKNFDSEMTDPVGFNVRYGWSSNVGINATVNPDFSQIEADVAQINYDPRRALFFPEKRPFFLDGIERFQTPTRLIYTRRIVNPVAAGKIAGKFGANTIGFISAADNSGPSLSEMDLSYVNALRLKRDLSDQNHIGLVFTNKAHDNWSNQVFAVDGRFVAKDTYTFRAQGGFSQTNNKDETGSIAPMWDVAANANGRKWSGSFSFKGYHSEFNPAVGFIERGDYVTVSTGPTRRFYGKTGAMLEQLSLSLRVTGNWDYSGFTNGDLADDRRIYPSFALQFRGGWRLTNFTWIEAFGYPENFFTNYFIKTPTGFLPYEGTPELANYGVMLTLNTPQLDRISASLKYGFGRDPNYEEWAPGNIYLVESKIKWNPTDQIRMSLRYNQQQNYRPSDGSLVSESRTPRVKIEYQITPTIFLRGVVQYTAKFRDNLRDNSRTELPIYFKDSDGQYIPALSETSNNIEADFLFSYRPMPGTLVFFGYGSSLTEPNRFRFKSMARQMDGFFLKISYLFQF